MATIVTFSDCPINQFATSILCTRWYDFINFRINSLFILFPVLLIWLNPHFESEVLAFYFQHWIVCTGVFFFLLRDLCLYQFIFHLGSVLTCSGSFNKFGKCGHSGRIMRLFLIMALIVYIFLVAFTMDGVLKLVNCWLTHSHSCQINSYHLLLLIWDIFLACINFLFVTYDCTLLSLISLMKCNAQSHVIKHQQSNAQLLAGFHDVLTHVCIWTAVFLICNGVYQLFVRYKDRSYRRL